MTLVHMPGLGYERKTAEEVVQLFRERQKAKGPQHEQMRDMLHLYNGDIAVPLPEIRRNEKSSIVNLTKQGVNQMAMRAASVMPNIICPPVPHGRTTDADANAKKRQRVMLSWWDEVGMQLKLRQRGRWLFAYAHSPVFVYPDFKEGRPNWRPVSPVNTFPSHFCAFDDMVPTDCIIASINSVGYCIDNWPHSSRILSDMKRDQLVEILHYVDAQEWHVVVTPRMMLEEVRANSFASNRALRATTLDWHPNLTGRPWVVIPRSISLEDPVSTYAGVLGMYEAAAELDALSKIARRKGVFWEEWLVANEQNGIPEIVTRADPYNGQVGVVRGGSLIRMSPEVQYSSDAGVDRYERNMRVEANIPSDFGGEASSNVRTGARADALIQSAVEPALQETHEILAASLEHENYIGIGIDKSYWSGTKKTVFFGAEAWEYDPGKVWETDKHKVDYSLAGADVNQLTIVPLQMVGAGILSRRTAMGMHPYVKDVDLELDLVTLDHLQDAALQNVQTLVSQPGGMPFTDLMEIMRMIRDGEADLIDAVAEMQRRAQERQAQQAQTMAQGQPGLNLPGQGAEQPLAIPPAGDAMGNLKNIFGNLRMQQMTTGPERGQPAA